MTPLRITALALMLGTAISAPAYAETPAKPGALDARIKTLRYQPEAVYKLTAHYGFSTAIVFEEGEDIETIAAGDSESWQITKPERPNVLFIKPLSAQAHTNLTVFTSQRIYSFVIEAALAGTDGQEAPTFRAVFSYPEDGNKQKKKNTTAQSNTTQSDKGAPSISTLNFEYSYSGANRLRPIRAFDDGRFTYFQFQDTERLPAIFAADEHGNESLINYSLSPPYLVIDRIGAQFTLRDGDTATCIFNEAYKGARGTQNKKTAINPPAPQIDTEMGRQAAQEKPSLKTALGLVPLDPAALNE